MNLPRRYKPEGKSLVPGGMSTVIVCRDTNLDRLVVIKSLQPGVEGRRILDELRALQRIRSKHVVQIYDVIRDASGNLQAIVEEYLPGGDLTSLTQPSTVNEFMKTAYAIAEGIRDIHAQSQVHRDIKRQNMKFDAEGCLKLFDFGLARDVTINASTVGAVGTPGYTAPELFDATVHGTTVFTQAIDTFAFGATLLAVMLGRLPAELRAAPPMLPARRTDFQSAPLQLPAGVAACLDACLDPTPSLRP